jgi:DNA-binding GntR family transcriptional regulator
LFFVDSFPAGFTNAASNLRQQECGSGGNLDGPELRLQTRAPASTGEAGSPICALTLPQQIADHLGHRIMTGDCPPGSRLKEEEFAELYSVSRGPVREAFRMLERRGFVEIVPRHGARVRAFDPADLAALFSIRAVLLGLAARQAAEQGGPELIEQLSVHVETLNRSAEIMDISPREHATTAGEAQYVIARHSGNRPLLRMLEELTGRALWRMAWADKPLDFTTRVRREQSAQFWTELLKALKARDAAASERTARALLEASRDHMISAMGVSALGVSALASPHAVSEAAD